MIKMPTGHHLSLVDVPGNDDVRWHHRIISHLKESQSTSIIPLIMIDATQGTFNLTYNKELKQIFDSKDMEKLIIVVFTKI